MFQLCGVLPVMLLMWSRLPLLHTWKLPRSPLCGSHVDRQVAAASETFPTHPTGIRLPAHASPHVDLQAAALSEPFPAQLTRIQLLLCVDSHDPLEWRHEAEPLQIFFQMHSFSHVAR